MFGLEENTKTKLKDIKYAALEWFHLHLDRALMIDTIHFWFP